MKNIKIYSIVYNDEQVIEYQRYDNSHIKTIEQLSYLFEYNVLIDVIDNFNVKEDYLGIFSHKFPFKTGLFKKKLYWLLENNPDFDIYGLCLQYNLKGKYLDFAEKVHPRFKELFYPLCKDLGLEVKEPEYVIYSSFVVMKTDIYRDYVNTIIKPAIYLLETKYKDLAWKDSNYKGLPRDQLKLHTELDYYPMFTFVLERLLNMYINNRDFKFKQLI
jgi:hypothetical protein